MLTKYKFWSLLREVVNPTHRVLSPTVNHLHKVLRERWRELISVEREVGNPAHRMLSPRVNHVHKVLREKDEEKLLCWERKNTLIRQFLQMASKHTTLFSQKDSTCYNKWLRVAKLQGSVNLHVYCGNKVWKISPFRDHLCEKLPPLQNHHFRTPPS